MVSPSDGRVSTPAAAALPSPPSPRRPTLPVALSRTNTNRTSATASSPSRPSGRPTVRGGEERRGSLGDRAQATAASVSPASPQTSPPRCSRSAATTRRPTGGLSASSSSSACSATRPSLRTTRSRAAGAQPALSARSRALPRAIRASRLRAVASSPGATRSGGLRTASHTSRPSAWTSSRRCCRCAPPPCPQQPHSLCQARPPPPPRRLQDPDVRLGRRGVEEIKAHPWFKGLDWTTLQARGRCLRKPRVTPRPPLAPLCSAPPASLWCSPRALRTCPPRAAPSAPSSSASASCPG